MKFKIIVLILSFIALLTAPVSAEGISELQYENIVDNGIDIGSFFDFLLDSLFLNVSDIWEIFFAGFLIAILSAMLNIFVVDIRKERFFYTVVSFALLASLLSPLMGLISDVSTTINGYITFQTGFVPLYTASLIASGNVVMGTVSNVVLLFLSQFLGLLIDGFLIKIVTLFILVSVCASLLAEISTEKITAFFKRAVNLTIVFISSIYIFVFILQGIAAKTADTIALKTARLAAGSFIPVIGSVISEGFGTIVSYLTVVKSTTGIAGIVSLFALFIPIILKCLAFLIVIMILELIFSVTENRQAATLLANINSGISFLISALIMALVVTVFGIATALMFGVDI